MRESEGEGGGVREGLGPVLANSTSLGMHPNVDQSPACAVSFPYRGLVSQTSAVCPLLQTSGSLFVCIPLVSPCHTI